MLIDYGLLIGVGLVLYEGASRIKFKVNRTTSPYILYSGKVAFNMKLTPHILVSGLSGQGKSKFVESLLINRNDINVTLLNVFREDLRGITCRRINTLPEIKNFLDGLLNEFSDIPEYIVIDELLALSIVDKSIIKQLTKILAVARHYNKFLICISQSATKDEIGSKQLFNSRVCFKMVEHSSYQTILGYVPEDKQLQVREYYYLTTEKGRGTVPYINLS